MTELLITYLSDLKKFNQQRIFWLKLSGFVALVVLLIVSDWIFYGKNNLYWYLVSAGLTLSVIWWYRTMMLIRQILNHKMIETEILKILIEDIKEIRKEVKSSTKEIDSVNNTV